MKNGSSEVRMVRIGPKQAEANGVTGFDGIEDFEELAIILGLDQAIELIETAEASSNFQLFGEVTLHCDYPGSSCLNNFATVYKA